MASIYKRPGSKFFMARYKTPDGKWKAASTKLSDPAEALRLAFTWEGASDLMRIDNPSAAQTDRVIRRAWEQFSGKLLNTHSVRQFVAEFMGTVKAQKAKKTFERYDKVTRDLLAHLGERADLDMKTIGSAELQGFVDADALSGRSSSTVDQNATLVRAIFNAAVRRGLIDRSPMASVEVPDAAAEEREAFTSDELSRLLLHARGTEWESAILLGVCAGLRITDATGLKWESVDFTENVLRFMPQKTARKKRVLTIPMHPRLAAHLAKIAKTPAAKRSPDVCPTLAACDTATNGSLSNEFAELMERANVDRKLVERDSKGVGHNFFRKGFHSLRHTFLGALANNDVPRDVRHMLGGHTTEKAAARYAHISTETARKAVNKITGPLALSA